MLNWHDSLPDNGYWCASNLGALVLGHYAHVDSLLPDGV